MYKCPNGNMASYNCMVETLFRHHKEGLVQAEDVIYFIEVGSEISVYPAVFPLSSLTHTRIHTH